MVAYIRLFRSSLSSREMRCSPGTHSVWHSTGRHPLNSSATPALLITPKGASTLRLSGVVELPVERPPGRKPAIRCRKRSTAGSLTNDAEYKVHANGTSRLGPLLYEIGKTTLAPFVPDPLPRPRRSISCFTSSRIHQRTRPRDLRNSARPWRSLQIAQTAHGSQTPVLTESAAPKAGVWPTVMPR